MHNKKSAINYTIKNGKRLHLDLFRGRDTLQSISGYYYRRVVIDDTTCMKFSITLKSKDTIYRELVTIFNQVKTHTRQDLEYFRSDNVGEYQGL